MARMETAKTSTKQTTVYDTLGIISKLCFAIAACLLMWSAVTHHNGEYVKINKPIDNGHGQIGIVQHKNILDKTYVVRYVKEVQYTNEDKTEFTITYVDGNYYKKEELDFLSDEDVIEVNGQFKEK